MSNEIQAKPPKIDLLSKLNVKLIVQTKNDSLLWDLSSPPPLYWQTCKIYTPAQCQGKVHQTRKKILYEDLIKILKDFHFNRQCLFNT